MPPKLLHVSAQVLDNHRFEPESRRVQVREQLTRGCSQGRSSQRRINKVNLRGGANSSLRAYLWRPRVLFLDKEDTFQRTDVPANGTRLNITHASHIRRDRCQLQLGRQVARQRAQQGCHCSWVTARFIIQARNVTDSNILKVRAQITLGVLISAHVLAAFQRAFRTQRCACCDYLGSGVTSSRQLDPTGGNAGRAPTLPPLGLTRARKGPRYAKRPLSPVGACPCCQALVRRRSSSAPARGHGASPRGRRPRGCRR